MHIFGFRRDDKGTKFFPRFRQIFRVIFRWQTTPERMYETRLKIHVSRHKSNDKNE